MNLSPLEKLNSPLAESKKNEPLNQEALRRAAEQFEAVLLMQLTSVLNGSNDDGEDSLFGSDGGSGLAKQMFSEQLATAMAESGGIGLADIIMQKFLANQPQAADKQLNPLQKTISAVKDIRNSEVRENQRYNFAPINAVSETAEAPKSIETFVPDAESMMNTRERIIADKPITYSEDAVPQTEVYSPNLVTAASPISSSSVSFQMPALGRISSTFGTRFHPIDKKVKFHGGLDVAIPTGTRVNSAADGVVSFAGKKGGYGNLVIVQHPDGRETRYGHLDKILVATGDSVSGGQEIAKSGSTGKSTGPHLHFEIRENGQVVNPLKILSNVLSKKSDR